MRTKASGKTFSVVQWAEVPTPPEAVIGGQISPGPQLVEALKALLQKLGPGTRDAVIAIPSQLALVRRLTMPKLPPKRLRGLIESQGQQFIPFFRDGATFDLVVINPNHGPTEQEILLVAVPTPVIQRLQAATRTAGIRLVSVDVDMIALYRANLAAGTLAPDEPVALLDAGHRRARLGIFRNGWPIMLRALDLLPLLPSPVEPPPDVRFLTPDEFAVEVRRTGEILLSQSRTEAVSALALSAHWSDSTMQEMLESEWRQGERAAENFRVVTPGREIPPGLALAYGLSLATAVKPYRLALLPRASVDVQRQRRNAALLLLATLAGAGAYGWFWYQKGLELHQESLRLAQAIAVHNADLAREKEIAAAEARIREYAPLEAVYKTTLPWTEFYPHLRSLLPQGVTLQQVSVNGTALTMNGRAATPEDAAEFIQRVHASPLIKPPILNTFTTAGGSFTVTAQIQLEGGSGR